MTSLSDALSSPSEIREPRARLSDAAVDIEQDTGYPGSGRRGEVHRRQADVTGSAKTAHPRSGDQLVDDSLELGDDGLHRLRLDDPGHDAVDPDARPERGGHRPGGVEQPTLRCVVGEVSSGL